MRIQARATFAPSGDFLGKVEAAALAGSNQAASILLGHAQEIVHVRSGELRGSGVTVEATTDGHVASAQAGFTADHAAFAEFGTGRRGAESSDAGDGPYNQDWPGMEPIPYLRPSLDTSRAEVLDAYKTEFAQAVRG